MKVLILTSSTGEGHNSAAYAIKDEFLSRNINAETAELEIFKKKKSKSKLSYTNIIKKYPQLFGVAYKLGSAYSSTGIKSPVFIANARIAEKLSKYIIENNFDVVVCAHLFAKQAMTEVRKTYIKNILTFGIFTDYTQLPFVEESKLDGYFVTHEEVAKHCAKIGMDKDKLHVLGIPVHNKFNEQITKQEARKYLNIDEKTKMFLIMAGGIGCGNVKALCDNLTKSHDNFFVYVLVGNNQNLKKRLEFYFKDDIRIIPVGFNKDVHYYLRACDVFISKPGGISTTEAAVVGVPLIHTIPIPGCETKNAKYFSKKEMSIYSKKPKLAIEKALELIDNPLKQENLIKNQKKYINPNSTRDIVDHILREYSGS